MVSNALLYDDSVCCTGTLTFMPLKRPYGWLRELFVYQTVASTVCDSRLVGAIIRTALVILVPVRGSVGAVLTIEPLTAAGLERPTSPAKSSITLLLGIEVGYGRICNHWVLLSGKAVR